MKNDFNTQADQFLRPAAEVKLPESVQQFAQDRRHQDARDLIQNGDHCPRRPEGTGRCRWYRYSERQNSWRQGDGELRCELYLMRPKQSLWFHPRSTRAPDQFHAAVIRQTERADPRVLRAFCQVSPAGRDRLRSPDRYLSRRNAVSLVAMSWKALERSV